MFAQDPPMIKYINCPDPGKKKKFEKVFEKKKFLFIMMVRFAVKNKAGCIDAETSMTPLTS